MNRPYPTSPETSAIASHLGVLDDQRMSCNGCRVLRKGCSDACMLRQSLQLIDSPQAQSHATLFVAKFFGRAALMSFVSAVPAPHRPALFQSLLFEAVGRTINPVGGAVGLIGAGNWHLCQSAVDTVLRGGALHALPEAAGAVPSLDLDRSSVSEVDHFRPPTSPPSPPPPPPPPPAEVEDSWLGLSLTSTPSEEEEESGMTTTAATWRSGSSESGCRMRHAKLLRLFV